MSLSMKLEGDKVERQCADEIKALHQVFVAWFRGTKAIPGLKQDLTNRMTPQFSHIAPNGHMVVGRDVLIKYLAEKYGCYSDRVFSIEVHNVRLLWKSPTHCLVSYEEWQSWDSEDGDESGQQQFGRLSTCLLERASNGLKWIHVHETWMEAEEPTVTGGRGLDEDTVMTGPVPPEDMKKRYTGASALSPADASESSADDMLPPPARQIIVLVYSETKSEEQENNQEQAQSLVKETNVAYTVVDVSHPGKTDVNSLLASSGAATYPQFFVQTPTSTTFWGTWEDFERSVEKESLAQDLRLSKAPAKEPPKKKPEDENMTHEERQFLEASQGILFFEDDEGEGAAPVAPSTTARSDLGMFLETEEETIQEKSNIDDQASQAMLSLNSASGVSHKRHISAKLEKYAKPLMFDNVLVGVSIAGFVIGTSQGSMADGQWYSDAGSRLEKLAQPLMGSRKVGLPEMVFPTAHVAIEGRGIWMSWDAIDCLTKWAESHEAIDLGSDEPNNGVSVLKVKDASKWEKKQVHTSGSGTFHYDWTFSTPFAAKMEGGSWLELDESGMRMDLLKDTSIPILFFDEIVLYEDDLHDNGQSQLSIKLRVMPTCAYILSRLWVRVDNVLVRVRETRVLVDFFGIKPQIYRDISWRECEWSELPAHGLPNDVKAWTCENGETEAWNNLVQNIPPVDLPEGMVANAVLEYKGVVANNKGNANVIEV